MVQSKGWEWEKANQSPWLKPCEDGYYMAHKWLDMGYKKILDLGAGLGRHTILFAKLGFDVSAIDLSEYGMDHLKTWVNSEKLSVDIKLGDMMELPYENESFDCVFAYHVISHSDTVGIKKVLSEIERVLKKDGQVYTSFCSKDSLVFKNSGYPKIDDNTVLNKEEGPELDVPHFYANLDDIIYLFSNFNIEKVRHIDYCYINSNKQDCKYYYVNASKK